MTNPLSPFVTKMADELFQVKKETEKIAKRVPPIGQEKVSKAELRKRWPTMGDAARKEFRMGLAKPGDELGIQALTEMLGG